MSLKRDWAVVVAILLSAGQAVLAPRPADAFEGPNTILYQGSLLDNNARAVPNGAYRMRFTVYATDTSGTQLWQETDPAVQVINGLFSTPLGDSVPFGALFVDYQFLWLEVAVDLSKNGTIEANEIYAPRQRLRRAVWAIDAETVDGRHAWELWSLTGNSGSTAGTHFIGTTDDEALDFRVNNRRALLIAPASTANLIGGHSSNTVWSGVVGSVIGGGGYYVTPINRRNYVTDDYGTIGGGAGNRAGNSAGATTDTAYATVGGGTRNIAGGYAATVPGGELCTAGGSHSFAAGYRAKANHSGSFVWSDDWLNQDAVSDTINQFKVRAEQVYLDLHLGWVRFNEIIPPGGNPLIDTFYGAALLPGGWTNGCDRAMKENFAPVDARDVLEQVAALPIRTWNHRLEAPSVRHMGPVAQDFRAAFGVGANDKTISTVDADGVALAAIQGLYKIVQEKDNTIADQQKRIADLEARLSAIEKSLPARALREEK